MAGAAARHGVALNLLVAQAPSLPILDEWIDGVKRTGGDDIALFTMAPKGKQKIDVLGYFFFCNDKFKPALDAKKKEIPAAYAQVVTVLGSSLGPPSRALQSDHTEHN